VVLKRGRRAGVPQGSPPRVPLPSFVSSGRPAILVNVLGRWSAGETGAAVRAAFGGGGSGVIGQREALRLPGCAVVDPHGHRLGIVGQAFLDELTEQPEWVTVETGLYGTNESFVPLAGATFDDGTLTVAVPKDTVRLVPRVVLDQGDLPS